MHAFADESPRTRTDRPGPAPLQEVNGAQRDHQGAAQAQILREALRGPAARRAAPAEQHPQGEAAEAQQAGMVTPPTIRSREPNWTGGIGAAHRAAPTLRLPPLRVCSEGGD